MSTSQMVKEQENITTRFQKLEVVLLTGTCSKTYILSEHHTFYVSYLIAVGMTIILDFLTSFVLKF